MYITITISGVFLIFNCVYCFNSTKIPLVIDSDILLARNVSSPGKSESCILKRASLNWSLGSSGIETRSIPLNLPNTASIQRLNNLQSWPVLSIDYGTKYIGCSLHNINGYNGKGVNAKQCFNLTNSGDVDNTCREIFKILETQSQLAGSNVLDRVLILVGFPVVHDFTIHGRMLFQTLYTLDFASRLSRFLYLEALRKFGDVSTILCRNLSSNEICQLDNACIACTLNLGPCMYIDECRETFNIFQTVQIGFPVVGVSEAHSTQQTNTVDIAGDNSFGLLSGRKDSLASVVIYQNFMDLLKEGIQPNAALILPSLNNVFRSHTKGDCLFLYKQICNAISARIDGESIPKS